jgi:hypothetical protein
VRRSGITWRREKATLSIELNPEEMKRLEEPYTPHFRT